MEAHHTSIALLLATLALAAPIAGAGTADNPNIVDDVEEPDPLTEGVTPVPDSLDVTKAWISQANTAVDFTIEVQSLFVPHSLRAFTGAAQGETAYEFRFDLDPTTLDGTLCEGATSGTVTARTSYGANAFAPILNQGPLFENPSTDAMWAYASCEGVGDVWRGFAEVDRNENRITIPVDRVWEDSFRSEKTVPFLTAGTTLENPEVVVYDKESGGLLSNIPHGTWDEAGPGTSETV